LHRWLIERGIDNMVVDSASSEVNRRARRAKTDRLFSGQERENSSMQASKTGTKTTSNCPFRRTSPSATATAL
jgi:hypothetical protein